MGGLAFASGPQALCTPRMPVEVYEAVKARCHEILKDYYTYVATPIEAPGKKDYGDVDFLVAGQTPLCYGSNIVLILSKALGAERSIAGKGSPTISFALPWPKDVHAKPTVTGSEGNDPIDDPFAQIDVHECHDKAAWEWELFHHAHGDLWNILGSTIRKLGLTVNDTGLYLRIEEIDLTDRKKSMVLLTKQPAEVLSFLGLDAAQWWQQFASAHAMFEYAASCRYFWVDDAVREVGEDKKALKHNDRKRMTQRPVFRTWVEHFVPECRASGGYDGPAPSREKVTADAFERFGVRDEYERRLASWRRERRADETWKDFIKAGLPTQDVDFELRAAAARGLKAIIIEDDLSDGVVPSKPLRTVDGSYDREAVLEFVQENWQRVGAIRLAKRDVPIMEKLKEKNHAGDTEVN